MMTTVVAIIVGVVLACLRLLYTLYRDQAETAAKAKFWGDAWVERRSDKAFDQWRQAVRTSGDQVMIFAGITDTDSARRVLAKLATLAPYGVMPEDLVAIEGIALQALASGSFDTPFREFRTIQFRHGTEAYHGALMIENAPGHGFRVQVGLPGVIASTAPGLLEGDVFVTDFLPLNFYT